MERLEYEYYEEFACDIADKFDSLEDEFSDISIIAKYNEAKEIIKELLCIGNDIASIDIHREEFEEYWDEYIIGLNSEGVWCEKFKRDNEYFDDTSSVVYVMDNCNSAVFRHIDSEEIHEVSVGEGECSDVSNDTSNSESTYVSRSKNGTPMGFSKTWTTTEDGMTCYSSYSHYSNNIGMLREIAEEFGVKL